MSPNLCYPREVHSMKFVQFVKSKARQLSNRNYETVKELPNSQRASRVLQTTVWNRSDEPTFSDADPVYCHHHGHDGHYTRDCDDFRKLPWNDRKSTIYREKLCYRCLGSHFVANCNFVPECSLCKGNHVFSMHKDVERRDPALEDEETG